MIELEKIFMENEGRLIHKWTHYFEIYDRYFRDFKNRKPVILEIGVSHGGSLQMWKKYFGDEARIYGIDVNPECKKLEEKNIEIFIGSQSDRDFLREVRARIPKVDILIDDGGHTMEQQIVTFEELFDHVKSEGIYLCEDTHTSYWSRYGGGHKRRGTFIEYTKNLVDQVNAFHSVEPSLEVDSFTRSAYSVHYYDSVVVFEKRSIERPADLQTGSPSFEGESIRDKQSPGAVTRIKYRLDDYIDAVLRFLRLPARRNYIGRLQSQGVYVKKPLLIRAYAVLKNEGIGALLKKAKNRNDEPSA